VLALWRARHLGSAEHDVSKHDDLSIVFAPSVDCRNAYLSLSFDTCWRTNWGFIERLLTLLVCAYGVATISRLLKIIDLCFKRAL